jgi:hypothetical protein
VRSSDPASGRGPVDRRRRRGRPAVTRTSPRRWPHPRPVPPATGRRAGDLHRRVQPLKLQPGPGWSPRPRPRRLRATFHCTAGSGTGSPCWTWPAGRCSTGSGPQTLAGVPCLPQADPGPVPTGWLHVVCDNYSPPEDKVTDWCATNGVKLVFTSTNASGLNWIESKFTALRYLPRRQQLPQPHRPRARDRRLPPLA